MKEWSIGLHRLQGIEHRGQLLVVHTNRGDRGLGRVIGFGGDGRHPIADEPHPIPAEDRHVAHHLADQQPWNLLARYDRTNSWYLPGRRGIDAEDASVGIGAAQDFGEQHARQRHIRRVARVSGDLVRAFSAWNGCSDDRMR